MGIYFEDMLIVEGKNDSVRAGGKGEFELKKGQLLLRRGTGSDKDCWWRRKMDCKLLGKYD